MWIVRKCTLKWLSEAIALVLGDVGFVLSELIEGTRSICEQRRTNRNEEFRKPERGSGWLARVLKHAPTHPPAGTPHLECTKLQGSNKFVAPLKIEDESSLIVVWCLVSVLLVREVQGTKGEILKGKLTSSSPSVVCSLNVFIFMLSCRLNRV